MPSNALMRSRILSTPPQYITALPGTPTLPTYRAPWTGTVSSRQSARTLANIRDDAVSLVGSNIKPAPSPRTTQDNEQPPSPPPSFNKSAGNQSPDERTLQLGKTVRTLHDCLPLLLARPLPQEILSPQISLHLFPSTHPHLPTVTGRISYTAALWTAPMAWGRVPVVGNVRLRILSERVVGHGVWHPPTTDHDSRGSGYRNEKLIVRWQTCSSQTSASPSAVDKISEFLGRDVRDDQQEFSGLFIFEFDQEGRVGRHTIEHAQQGGDWERMTRVVSVTDWLIGLAKGRRRPAGGWALGCERVWVQAEGGRGDHRARFRRG